MLGLCVTMSLSLLCMSFNFVSALNEGKKFAEKIQDLWSLR